MCEFFLEIELLSRKVGVASTFLRIANCSPMRFYSKKGSCCPAFFATFNIIQNFKILTIFPGCKGISLEFSFSFPLTLIDCLTVSVVVILCKFAFLHLLHFFFSLLVFFLLTWRSSFYTLEIKKIYLYVKYLGKRTLQKVSMPKSWPPYCLEFYFFLPIWQWDCMRTPLWWQVFLNGISKGCLWM